MSINVILINKIKYFIYQFYLIFKNKGHNCRVFTS